MTYREFFMVEHGFAEIEAVVFDAVGTVIEPDPPVAAAYVRAAARQGVELDLALVRERFHRAFRIDDRDDPTLDRFLTSEAREYRRWRSIVENVLPEVPDLDRCFLELWGHFGTAESWSCFDDVSPLLDALDELRIPYLLASNFDARLRDVLSGLEELRDRFVAPVISSEIGFRKPHPGFYAEVFERLGVSPCRVLWIGDDAVHDVDGPRREGARSLLIDRKARQGSPSEGVVHDLSGIHAWFSPASRVTA